jgi:alpha-1,3-glucosyltransferase
VIEVFQLFRYNSAMLGLSLWAIVAMWNEYYFIGAVFFCLSLFFKQMALFYALPFFFYLLGISLKKGLVYKISCSLSMLKNVGARLTFFTVLAISVITTFVACLTPFLSSIEDVKQVFIRVFPVQRGLYEDKVANFWCAANVLIKFREILSLNSLIILRYDTDLLP